VTPLEWASAVGTVGGAFAVIGAAATWLARREPKVRRVVTGAFGDGQNPGVLGRLEKVESAVVDLRTAVNGVKTGLDAVQDQLSPNHGGSFHDVLVRVDERTGLIVDHLDHVERRLDDHIASHLGK
jgi:hypothetical protein